MQLKITCAFLFKDKKSSNCAKKIKSWDENKFS